MMVKEKARWRCACDALGVECLKDERVKLLRLVECSKFQISRHVQELRVNFPPYTQRAYRSVAVQQGCQPQFSFQTFTSMVHQLSDPKINYTLRAVTPPINIDLQKHGRCRRSHFRFKAFKSKQT